MEEDPDAKAVTTLCRGLARLIELDVSDKKLEKYIEKLQLICSGSLSSEVTNYYNYILSPIECLSSILRLPHFLPKLRSSYSDAHDICRCILGLQEIPYACNEALSTLIPDLLIQLPEDDACQLLDSLWKHEDCEWLSPKVVELMVTQRSAVERMVISVYGIMAAAEVCGAPCDPWVSRRLWIERAAVSPVVFSAMASAVNSVVLSCARRDVALSLAHNFSKAVAAHTDTIGISREVLYPVQCIPAVSLLNTQPSEADESFKESLSEEIGKCDPRLALLLLSHFPEWMQHVNLS